MRIIDPATDIPLSIAASDPNYDALEPAAYHVAGGLASFANHSATIALSVPTNDPFGTDSQYYVGMYVDADGNVAEADETNNRNRGDGLDRQSVIYSATFSNPASNYHSKQRRGDSVSVEHYGLGPRGNGGRRQRIAFWFHALEPR